MHRTRMLVIPLLWLAAAVVVGFLSLPARQVSPYLAAHFHFLLSLAAILALFGAIYLALGLSRCSPYRKDLALAHWSLSAGGSVLIFAPRFGGWFRAAEDPAEALKAFRLWNTLAAVGYVMTLLGLVVFVVLLVLRGSKRRLTG